MVADVAVNRAVTNGVNPLPRWLTGSSKSRVPTVISPPNAYIRIRGDANTLEGTLRVVTVRRTGLISS